MNPEIEVAIRVHAAAEYLFECCGLIVSEQGRDVYIRCRNVALRGKAGKERRGEQFVMHKQDYFAATDRGEIVAVVHAHPDVPARPSQADRVSSEASGHRWYIVRVDGTEGEIRTAEIEVLEAIELQGTAGRARVLYHGVLDCYSLIRDWFDEVRGIQLPDFDRRDNWWADGSGDDLYMQQFQKADFVAIEDTDIKVGDCFLMQVRAKVANHAAVYVGNGEILHHLYGRPSRKDIYGGYWREVTRLVVRYRG